MRCVAGMVDTRQVARVKPPGVAGLGWRVGADTIGEERSPSWSRAPHWKCGIPGNWYRGFESLSLRISLIKYGISDLLR
jgi:hypothetical protein